MTNSETPEQEVIKRLPYDEQERDTYIKDIKEKNLTFFKNHFIELYKRVVDYTPQAELVFLENGEPDVLYNGIYFYDQVGAYTYSETQLKKNLEKPTRFSTGRLDGMRTDPDTSRYCFDVIEKCNEKNLTFEERHTSARAFHLHIFGIGLGLFVEHLIKETDAHSIVIYEVNFELFFHSLSITDWASALEPHVQPDKLRHLRFQITTDETAIINALTGSIRGSNPATADGLFTYHHYKNSTFSNAHAKLTDGEFEVSLLGLGFYEDEYHMLSNAYENLSKGNVRLYKQHPAHIDAPVLICANGPSLDTLIEFIKKNQKKCVIISCGSTLDSLLSNGIKPDFHVMIERSSLLKFDQEESASKWKIDDICFVGSTNIYPGVPDFHKNKILFFRAGICPRAIFATSEDQVPANSDPLVANAALMFAMSAGFKNVYFCGVDAGAKDPNYHHSKDSQYTTRKIKYNFDFNKTAPGNFGGTIRSTSILLWSRKHLQAALNMHFRRHTFFNLSDGVLIKGARPKHHSKVKFDALKGKKELVKKVIESFPVYTREEFDKAWEKANLKVRLAEVRDQLKKIIEEDDLKEFGYLSKFIPILKSGTISDPVAMIYRGTVHHMLMHIFTNMERAPDQETKIEFEKIVKECFPIHMDHLHDQIAERIEKLEAGEVEFEVGVDLHWQRPWQKEFIKKAGIQYEDLMQQYLVKHDKAEEP